MVITGLVLWLVKGLYAAQHLRDRIGIRRRNSRFWVVQSVPIAGLQAHPSVLAFSPSLSIDLSFRQPSELILGSESSGYRYGYQTVSMSSDYGTFSFNSKPWLRIVPQCRGELAACCHHEGLHGSVSWCCGCSVSNRSQDRNAILFFLKMCYLSLSFPTSLTHLVWPVLVACMSILGVMQMQLSRLPVLQLLSLPRVVEAAGVSLILGEEKVVGFCEVGAGVAEWAVLY
ncbi:hypothetical protein VNO80_26327 [Phaseolus coccineus]|uniref:Uncharacterized protein n=1 Tax=Phaseolus coccineus TaxID=3886 RepID=A0AAN9LHS8_PHACN